MFMTDEMFFRLVLVDKIAKLFDDTDRKKREIMEIMTGQKRPREDNENSDTNTVDVTSKRLKTSMAAMIDASTQTDI